MSTFLVDFAFCPCGERTAIQPTKPVIPDTNPQPLSSVEGSIAVACMSCKRVYRFDTGYLLSLSTPAGVGPENPEAPTTVFRVPIECAEPNCKARATVFVTMSTTTSAVRLDQEKATWRWEHLTCPTGHVIPDRRKAQP